MVVQNILQLSISKVYVWTTNREPISPSMILRRACRKQHVSRDVQFTRRELMAKNIWVRMQRPLQQNLFHHGRDADSNYAMCTTNCFVEVKIEIQLLRVGRGTRPGYMWFITGPATLFIMSITSTSVAIPSMRICFHFFISKYAIISLNLVSDATTWHRGPLTSFVFCT